jgi:hypothetical protein
MPRQDLFDICMLASSPEVAHLPQPAGVLDIMQDYAQEDVGIH